jgi:hypothetical protein
MDAAGDHADPGHPSHTAACPRRAPGPHFGLTQRTRQRTDTGRPHRTPDSGHLDAQTPAPDTGQRSRGQASVDTGRSHRTPDTGHWTPDAGRGRGQGDEGAAGIRTSWATTPSDRTLGRPTVFLWTAPAALDSPCRLHGEAAFQREIAFRRQLLGRSAGVERRLGALLCSDDYGSSVEPTATLHPLWRGLCSRERSERGGGSVKDSGAGIDWGMQVRQQPWCCPAVMNGQFHQWFRQTLEVSRISPTPDRSDASVPYSPGLLWLG